GVIEMFDVVIGVDRGEPDAAAKAALHPPHPLDGVRIDSSDRRIQRNAAEDLDALEVLAHEPGSVGCRSHVILEDDSAHAGVFAELRALWVVEGGDKDFRPGGEGGREESDGGTAGGGRGWNLAGLRRPCPSPPRWRRVCRARHSMQATRRRVATISGL